jgi:ABC-type branched-subunit amino acid transport system substrate-binding protein
VLLGAFCAVLVGFPTGAIFAFTALVGLGDGGGSHPPERVAKIGLIVPLSGDLADVGAVVRNAVELAVEEANQAGAVPGWTLELVVYDDLSRPDGGATAAESLAADDAVVGVVGPLNSTVAMVAMPTLADAGIAVVSPSNGRPDLTSYGEDPRDRPYGTYFRLAGTDDLQAKAAAEYVVNTLGRPRVAVVEGGPNYGDSIARRFATQLRAAGGEVVSFHPVDESDDDVSGVAGDLRDDAPDAVYVATGPEFAGKLRDRLAVELPSVPIVGPDALLSSRYLDGVEAEAAAEGDLVTELGAPLSELPGAEAFVAAYAQRWFEPFPDQTDTDTDTDTDGGGESNGRESNAAVAPDGASYEVPSPAATPAPTASPSPTASLSVAERWASETLPSVAAYAYDAARAVIRAAGVVLPGRPAVDEAARGSVVAAVARGSFVGVTGPIAFDRWGDPVAAVATVYTVLGDRFVPLKVVRR